MGRLADYVAAYVDDAIRRIPLVTAVGTVVTSPSQVTSDPLTIVVDGSATAVPVKQVRGLPMIAGARVVLARFGSEWVVIGSLTNPGVAGSNASSRIVIGADTPPELKSFGIDTAMLSYVTDHATGLEVGYFWIGTSNRYDGNADNIVQGYGNVCYPIPGVPTSATFDDVMTNMQTHMHSPYPQTVFKDQTVELWTNLNLRRDAGFSQFLIDGRAQGWGVRGRGYSNNFATGSTGTEVSMTTANWNVEPAAVGMRSGRVYRFSWKGNVFVSGGTIAQALGTVRIRQGATATTAPSAGAVVCTSYIEATTNFASHGDSGWGYGSPSASGDKTFSVTVQKGAGTGTQLNIGGDANSMFVVEIEDVGETADWSGMYTTF